MSCMLLLTSTLLTGALLTLQAMARPGPTALPPAKPVEPIEAILDAFKTHNVVALDEGSHGNEQGHAFRLALLRDPRFPDPVNDIVVAAPRHHRLRDESPQHQLRQVLR